MLQFPELVGVLATIAAGPFAASLRTWWRQRRGALITIESSSHIGEARIASDDSGQQVAQKVKDLVDQVRTEQRQRGADRSSGGGKPAWLSVTITDCIYGLTMLLGIAAKAAWDFSNKHGRFGIDWGDAATALLVAPIVYVGAAASIAPLSKSVSLVGLGLAFQNGFFWQSVFATQAEAQTNGK